MKAKDLLLILACVSYSIVIGGALYEHFAVIPRWSAAPPASLTMFQGEYGLNAALFWMVIHPVTLLLVIAALALNWKSVRRKNIITALAGYFIILIITTVYFVPQLIGIIETPLQASGDSALTAKASMWETLSILRLLFMLVLAVILLNTLTKPAETLTVRSVSGSAPLSYPNDALGG